MANNMTPSRRSGPEAINNFNAWMKQQPWYQEFFRRHNVNPNRVQLSRGQQSELERIMKANGIPLGDGVHIDNAGNLNEKNRLVRNAAIIGGATAGAIFGAPAIAGMFGTSAPAAGTAASLGAVPELGVGAIPSILGPGLTAAGTPWAAGTAAATAAGSAAPSLMSRIGDAVRNPQVWGAAGRMISGAGETAAQNRGAQTAAMMDYEDRKRQLEQNQLLAEKSARDAQSDAMNKAIWGNYVANYQPSIPEDVRPFAGNIRTPSEAERQAGRTLSQQANDLMASGRYTNVNPTMTPFSEFPTEPGTFERISNYAGPGLTFLGLYDQLFGRR